MVDMDFLWSEYAVSIVAISERVVLWVVAEEEYAER
jgi:hypothetical protein